MIEQAKHLTLITKPPYKTKSPPPAPQMFDKRNNRKINKSLNHYPKLAGLLYTFTNVEELLLRKHISGWNERGNESKTAKPQWLLAKPTYQETLKGIPKPSVSES